MSGHEIVWTFDRDRVASQVVCTQPVGADCRLGARDYNVCGCESWNILRDDDAAPYHFADGGDRSIGDRHYMTDTGECQVALFLNESGYVEELLSPDADADEFVIGRTPIEPVWAGDSYDWKPAEVSS